MKIYDGHIHQTGNDIPPEKLLRQMESGGVYGGAIFSVPPAVIGMPAPEGMDAGLEARLNRVLDYTKPFPDRLLPVLWIHPDEPDTLDGIQEAAKRGIRGFKVICNNFYVYEDKSMEMLAEIAKTGLPVIFHTGILWDKGVSGDYCRPLNWEHLIKLPNLRFSLAHCSWPWYDECIALYSKFLNLANDPDFTTEMFLDLTPGTPAPYRKDLLSKLVYSGYDVFHNMLYGTDCNTASYASDWAAKWLNTDQNIFDACHVSLTDQERIFSGNFLRFFKLSSEGHRCKPLNTDGT